MKRNNDNVLYVEPNYVGSIEESVNFNYNGVDYNTNQSNLFDIAPPMEDYCITVDLQVEVKSRYSNQYESNNKKFVFTWSSKPDDGKGTVSFFEGKNLSFGTSNAQYLTTDPTDFGTYSDILNENTNECFGINSIDIMYNNYMVPEIIIEFTDIRGISLFAPEELRHHKGGNIDNDIAGSFFKCFFTFPYPVFRLMVKGFYGEPTCYELCCSDFRAKFDCNTGNFGATAKFVGYAFSLLNDVTLNALVASPYSEYAGKQYWEDNLPTRFKFENGEELITIIQLLSKLKEIKKNLNKLSQIDTDSIRLKNLSNIDESLTKITSSYQSFFNAMIKSIKDCYTDEEYTKRLVVNDSKKVYALYSEDNNNEKIKLSCKAEYNYLTSSINEAESISFSTPSKGEINFKEIDGKTIDILLKYDVYLKDLGELKYVYIYDGSSFNEELNNAKIKSNNNIIECEKRVSKKEKNIISDALGFDPTVENVTRIVMAHFETFIHCIYHCSEVVNLRKRKASDIGLGTTDIKLLNDVVPPFPRVDIRKNENGVDLIEEGWLGDLREAYQEEEVSLINGLLKGTNDIYDIILQASKNIEAIKGDNVMSIMDIPLCPIDIIINKNPFNSENNFTNLSDLAGKIGLRAFTIFGLSDVCNDYKNVGKADAINFIKSNKTEPSETFKTRLCNGQINSDLIIDMLANRNESERINDSWIWDSNLSSRSQPFMIYNYNIDRYNYSLHIYGNENQLLPIQNFNWKKIDKDLNTEGKLINKEDYFSINEIIPKETENDSNKKASSDINDFVFKIDLAYKSYENYIPLMKLDDKNFDYVEDLGLKFSNNKYLARYYYNCPNQFARTFKYSANDVNVSFKPNGVEDCCLLPSSRPTDTNEVNKSSIFYGRGLDCSFEFIKDTETNGKMIKRKLESFSYCFNEFDSIKSFTIPTFCGIDKMGSITNDVSIFGQKEYYRENDYGKAFLFLYTFSNFECGMRNRGCFNVSQIEEDLLDNKKHFTCLPYFVMLLIGGYLWHENQERRELNISCKDIILNKFNDKLTNLRDGIRLYLINMFEEWVNNNGEYGGFKLIKENFELKSNLLNSPIELIDEINNFFHEKSSSNYSYFRVFNDNVKKNYEFIDTFETYLMLNEDDKFYENYISVANNKKYGLKLFNRETSSAIYYLTTMLLKPCMVCKPTKFIFKKSKSNYKSEYTSSLDIKTSNFRNYVNGFLDKLKEYYKDKLKKDAESIYVSSIDSDNNIKISLYKYIKILWDKWLSGTKESDWTLENFYYNNWYFIDSFYNKIGQEIRVDIVNFCADAIYSQKETSYSMLSFLAKTYAKDRFAFHCVQNFLDLTDSNLGAEKMASLFKPIPHCKIDYDNVDKHPSFVIMYTYEYSSKLNIEGSEYEDDSYDISSDDEYLPLPIKSKTNLTGYKIPAFGVSYGRQYQSYFKNIDVSMENPIATEQSIKAQFMIASMHGNKGENGKDIATLGQDLYTIYSNNSYTCTVTMMGCAWIQPLMYFQLLNIPMFRGAYLIQKVTHKITPGNMETTFIGTRMSRNTTAKVNSIFAKKSNNETSSTEIVDRENRNADIINDCEYKFFNPLMSGNMPKLTNDELNMSLGKYEDKMGGTFDEIVQTAMGGKDAYKGETVLELLGRIVQKEAEGEDKLGKQLVATVLFNRYMSNGKDFIKTIYGVQHSISNSNSSTECKEIAKEIFTQSPAILIGQLAVATKLDGNLDIPIWDNGIMTGEYTISKEITSHDAKSIDGYCSIRGYYALDENKEGGNGVESFGYWQRAKYSFQHKGHVFVAGFKKYDSEHWQITHEDNTFVDSNEPNYLAKSLYDSISKTIKFTEAIKDFPFEMKKDEKNPNAFYIFSEKPILLANVFDICINTYYPYVKEAYWVVQNTLKDLPYCIKIVANKNGDSNKIFAIAIVENGEIKVPHAIDDLNDFFYIILNKHYGRITESKDNIKSNDIIFFNECTNFSGMKEEKNYNEKGESINWEKKINGLLEKNVQDCGALLNKPVTKGFSFIGDGIESNKGAKLTKFKNFNIKNATDYLIANYNRAYSSGYCGNCAAAVKKALIAGGATINNNPNSACRYADFLGEWGFEVVYKGFSPETEGYTPMNGDISVIAGIAGSDKTKHGHIQMFCNGNDNVKGWYSDYKGSKVYCYNSPNDRPYIVYRWPKQNNS